jgi:hypothetical protein
MRRGEGRGSTAAGGTKSRLLDLKALSEEGLRVKFSAG